MARASELSGGLERLTRRELQVAVLVASGLSDREIAERLLVTRRTAEWHVEQILTKAGLKSRSQIAALVSEAETLGIPLLDARRPSVELPAQAAAFLGYKAEFSQNRELLETTRLLTTTPGEETDTRRQERLMSLAEAGYNPVVVGFIYAAALGAVAKQYPKTQFAIVDDSSLSAGNPNVTSLVFADHEGSYLVGAIAAQASRATAVGFIGGVDVAFIRRFHAGYAAGVAAINPDIRIIVKYLTSPPDFAGFADPAKGRGAAEAMYQAGADIIYHAAGGSGVGVFEAAKAAGGFAIGVDSDQYLTAPLETKACILTSMLKRVDAAAQSYVRAIALKLSLPRTIRYDLANEGVGYSKSNPLVEPYVATADRLRERIVSREVMIPEQPRPM